MAVGVCVGGSGHNRTQSFQLMLSLYVSFECVRESSRAVVKAEPVLDAKAGQGGALIVHG